MADGGQFGHIDEQNIVLILTAILFTTLHEMQTRPSDENSARLSVRPSVKRVDYDKTKKISVDFYRTKDHFLRIRMVGGATPST